MHACGHDIHITTMIGTARALVALKKQWHGTLMLVGQPSEELVDGARAMLADHLYERFGTPDMVIGLHDTNTRAAGTVAVTSGPAMAGVTSVDVVTARSRRPRRPPAGRQGSRRHGGGVHRTTPDHREPAGKSARSRGSHRRRYSRRHETKHHPQRSEIGARPLAPSRDQSQQIILDGIQRTAQGVALSAGVPADLAPIVTILPNESSPPTYNDPALTARVKSALVTALRHSQRVRRRPHHGERGLRHCSDSRDIAFRRCCSGWARSSRRNSPRPQAAGKLAPGLHTSRFQPDPELTLRTGVTAMTSVAISLLHK